MRTLTAILSLTALVALVCVAGCTVVGEAAGWSKHVVDPKTGEYVEYTKCRACYEFTRADGKAVFYCPPGTALPGQAPAARTFDEPLPELPAIENP